MSLSRAMRRKMAKEQQVLSKDKLEALVRRETKRTVKEEAHNCTKAILDEYLTTTTYLLYHKFDFNESEIAKFIQCFNETFDHITEKRLEFWDMKGVLKDELGVSINV